MKGSQPFWRVIGGVSLLLAGCAQAGVLIENVRLVNPPASVSALTRVYLEKGRITAIDPQLQADGADQRIDGNGGYLTPGLIDSHVHLSGVPGESNVMPGTVREAALAQIPRSYLYFGFTTVLDLISVDAVIEHWNRQPQAPRAYHCVGVPIPGGYPLAWLEESEQLLSPAAEFYLYDQRQAERMAATPGSEAHKPEALVRRIAQTGARCIKVFYETGFGRLKNLPVPTATMMRELVAEAHRHGLPVYLHGNSEQAHEFALQTGVDMVVHGLWHGERNTASALARRVADTGLKVQPTLQVLFGEQMLFDPSFFQRPMVPHSMPEPLMRWYESPNGQWMAREMAQGLETDGQHRHQAARDMLAQPVAVMHAYFAELLALGGTLVFGSDTPSGPFYTQFPGLNGRLEMQRWLEAGASLEQLFFALTLGNAQVMGLAQDLGSVALGKRADLLLMADNPLETLDAYDRIEWVFVEGKPIARETLSAKASLALGQGDVELKH